MEVANDRKKAEAPPNPPGVLNLGVIINQENAAEYRLEHYKATVNHWLELQKHELAQKRELTAEKHRSADRAATAALGVILLINGGAAVAVLNVMARAKVGDPIVKHAHHLANGLAWFSIGVVTAAFATGLKYLAQKNIAYEKDVLGYRLNSFSLGCWGGAVGAFGIGAHACYLAL